MMAFKIFLQLNDRWALGYDPLQWMLMRAKNRRGQRDWQPMAFIGSTKCVLRRCLREKDAELTSEAEADLDAMPDTFKKWLRLRDRLQRRAA